MANEVHFDNVTGATLYFCRFTHSGNVFLTSGSAHEVWGTGSRIASSYAVTMSEIGSSAHFVGDFDSASAITAQGINDSAYKVVIYKQAGASPADADSAVGYGTMHWSGVQEDFIPRRTRIR
jgi:hypothetical protein